MKVGFLIDRWWPLRGGLEAALAALVEHLIGGGHEALVFGLEADAGAPGRFVALPVTTSRRGALERELADRFVEAARRERCDATVAVRHASSCDVYWPHGGLHAATLHAGEQTRPPLLRPLTALLHRLSPRHSEFLALEEQALRGGASRIWCVSDLTRREILAAYPEATARVELHPNGVDRGRFHPDLRDRYRHEMCSRLGIAPNVPVLLFAATNWRLKGWREAVSALEGLQTQPWVCLLGGGHSAEAALVAGRRGLASRVVTSPTTDMEPMLGAADLLVQPTRRDPCSLTTLEALAAGVPVITTTSNGASEAITTPGAGTVIAPRDVRALAIALMNHLERLADPVTAASGRREAREASAKRDHRRWLEGLTASLEALVATKHGI